MPSAERAAACADRAVVYRGLALLFRPEPEAAWSALRDQEMPALCAALARLGDDAAAREADRLAELLGGADAARLARGYTATFCPSAGLRCALTETSHLPTTPQEGLVRTFEMADVAGFYRAFGVEVTPGSERPDHIAAELEFMHLLAVKEALALRREDAGEQVEVCRDAARSFVEDHLARFAARLAERLAADAADPIYEAAGRLLERFVAADADRLGASDPPRCDRPRRAWPPRPPRGARAPG